MGYYWMMAFCCACHLPTSFNPHKVPSLLINGKKEPLCQRCAVRWNELHPGEARPIDPAAYEPADESEM